MSGMFPKVGRSTILFVNGQGWYYLGFINLHTEYGLRPLTVGEYGAHETPHPRVQCTWGKTGSCIKALSLSPLRLHLKHRARILLVK